MNSNNETSRVEVLNGVEAYLETLRITTALHYAKSFPNLKVPKFETEIGRRYVKIVKVDSQRMVQGFIDLTNGDILKAATWRAPAKHARGNVLQAECIRNNFNLSVDGFIPYMR